MNLRGQRILVPRGGEIGARWATAIEQRGGAARIMPMIETAPPLNVDPLIAAVAAWNRGDYDWAIVTSARGAEAFASAGARAAGTGRFAAVGPTTAEQLSQHGFSAELMPPTDFSAEGLAKSLREAIPAPSRMLLPLSEIADTVLETSLAEAGHSVERVDAYRTVPAPVDRAAEAEVAKGGVDMILVSSGSVAREIVRRFAPLPEGTLVIAIGPPTARSLQQLGVTPDIVASSHTLEGMLDAAERLLAETREVHGAPQHPSP